MSRFRRMVRWLPLAFLVIGVAVWMGRWAWDGHVNRRGEAERQRVLQRVRDAGVPITFEQWREQAGFASEDDLWSWRVDYSIDPSAALSAEAKAALQARDAGELLLAAAHRSRADALREEPESLLAENYPHRPTPEWIAALTAYLQRHGPTLGLIDEAMQADRIDLGMDRFFGNPFTQFEAQFTRISSLRALATLLVFQQWSDLVAGRSDRVAEAPVSILRLGDSTRSLQRRTVVELVRYALLAMSARSVEKLLAYDEPDDAALRRLRAALVDAEKRFDPHQVLMVHVAELAFALEHPRMAFHYSAMGTAAYLGEEPEADPDAWVSPLGGIENSSDTKEPDRPGWIARAIEWIGEQLGQDWSRSNPDAGDDEATRREGLRLRAELAERTRDLADRPGRLKAYLSERTEQTLDAYLKLKGLSLHGAYQAAADIDLPSMSSRAPLRLALSTLAHLRLAILAIDLELYRREHGDWPATPAEIGGDWPVDPFVGKAMRYRQTDFGCVIYSIGSNLVDDGGDDYDSRADVIHRLFDPGLRNSQVPHVDPEGNM